MNIKILTIDDEVEILETLEMILCDGGYEVVKASSGDEAVANFEAGSFGLVITDMRMPGMSGLEVLQQVKQIDNDVEVIILTGYGTMENAIHALRNEGAYDYLEKPLEDIEKLLLTVENALENRRLNIENKRLVRELSESEQRYRLIAENTTDVIWVVDPDGQMFTYVSPSVYRMLGFTVKESMNRSLPESVTPASLEFIQETTPVRIEQMLQGDNSFYTDEIEVIHKDGHIIPTEVNMHFVKNKSTGRIEGNGVMRDITMRKRAESEKDRLIIELRDALARVKVLSGIIPICMHCKQIRNDKGYWNQLEKFIATHSDAQFSHSICDSCLKKHYPEFANDE